MSNIINLLFFICCAFRRCRYLSAETTWSVGYWRCYSTLSPAIRVLLFSPTPSAHSEHLSSRYFTFFIIYKYISACLKSNLSYWQKPEPLMRLCARWHFSGCVRSSETRCLKRRRSSVQTCARRCSSTAAVPWMRTGVRPAPPSTSSWNIATTMPA